MFVGVNPTLDVVTSPFKMYSDDLDDTTVYFLKNFISICR